MRENIDGMLEVKIGRSKRRYPFSIIRIAKNRMSMRLYNFEEKDKWALRHLLNRMQPDKVAVVVYSRYVASDRSDRYYFSLYTFDEALSSYLTSSRITLPCTLYVDGWMKSFDVGVRLIIRLNEKGAMRLFDKLI